MMRTIKESSRAIPVVHETDVLVVGGGPAGVSAAIAAARAGVDVMLLERYGALGGLATGGLVIAMVGMTDKAGRITGGLCQTLTERLDAMGALDRQNTLTEDGKARVGIAQFDYMFAPEHVKYLMNQMVLEAGARVRFHTFGVGAVVDGGHVRALITESKAGREAIAAKLFIDTTGDGDMAVWCGAPFETSQAAPDGRFSASIGMPFRMSGVDVERALQFRDENRGSDEYKDIVAKLVTDSEVDGKTVPVHWRPGVHAGVVWVNAVNFPGLNPFSPEDLTEVEIQARQRIFRVVEAYRRHMPGFEDAHVLDVATQVGVREARRIVGEHVLTREDLLAEDHVFEDSIGLSWNGPLERQSRREPGHSLTIPYRCLLPRGVDNLLFAGRCISVEGRVLEYVRLIPTCMVTGEAAGTAAAMAVKQDSAPARLDVSALQETLRAHGAIL